MRSVSHSTSDSTLVGEDKASIEAPPSSKFKEVDLATEGGDVLMEKTPTLEATLETMDKADAGSNADFSHRKRGAIYLDWEQDDESRPRSWTKVKKWATSLSIMWATFAIAGMTGGYEACYDGLLSEFKASEVVYMLGDVIFMIGVALAPLLLAPWSERVGRKPVLLFSTLATLLFFLGQTLAKSIVSIVITRGIQGFVGGCILSISVGVHCDLFQPMERGLVLALHALVVVGTHSMAPLYSSWVVYELGWRAVFWLQASIALVAFVLIATVFQETSDSVLLTRRARRLTELTTLEHRTDAMDETMSRTLLRPLRYIVTEPIVLVHALWFASVICCAFILLYELPWWTHFAHEPYRRAAAMCLIPFAAIFAGAILAFVIDVILQCRGRRSSRREHRDIGYGDTRLAFALAGAILFVVGSATTAVSGYTYVHLALPIVGLFLMGLAYRSFAIFPILLSTYTTLSEIYEAHTSSAVALLTCIQYLFLLWVPLVVPKLHDRFGLVAVGGFVTLISALLVLFPCALVFQGDRLRMKSKEAVDNRRYDDDLLHSLGSPLDDQIPVMPKY